MRSSFRSLLFVAAISFAGLIPAHADTVTLSFTEQASGTLGTQSFTNQNVTFSGSFTTAQLAACQLDSNCFDPSLDEYSLFTYQGLTSTISVGGLGAFDADSGNNYVNFYYGGGSLDSIMPYSGGDSNGHLYFPTIPSSVITDCFGNFPSFYCPLYASTSGGDLILTSVSDTYTTAVDVSSSSSVPEPSTLTLLTTGIIGCSEILRRRRQSV